MPRYSWMTEIVEDSIDAVGDIFAYAKIHFRTEEVYKKIEEITNIVKNELKEFIV